jgi:hypothetical protein
VFHAITIGQGDLTGGETVGRAARRCLELLDTFDLNSIAFPAIGAGAAGFAYQDVAVQMASVIVDSLKGRSRPLGVTIYLFDRFRRLQPIDYLDFFEEFAIRTKGLDAELDQSYLRKTVTARHRKQQKSDRPAERRKKQVEKLRNLDRERQTLEAKLAEYHGILTKKEIQRVEKRLQEVHRERVDALQAVKPHSVVAAVSVFVSYAHADEKLRKELGKHLSVLERQGLISTWHDRMIPAGTEWNDQIDSRLNGSRVILLLVSSDFINSQYCYDVEMKRALNRHEKKEALVIPVMLRPVVLRGTPFAKLQALPKDARPVTDWPSLDAAFVDVTEGLRDALLTMGAASA